MYAPIEAELLVQENKGYHVARNASIRMSPFMHISGPTNGACLGAVTIEILHRILQEIQTLKMPSRPGRPL